MSAKIIFNSASNQRELAEIKDDVLRALSKNAVMTALDTNFADDGILRAFPIYAVQLVSKPKLDVFLLLAITKDFELDWRLVVAPSSAMTIVSAVACAPMPCVTWDKEDFVEAFCQGVLEEARRTYAKSHSRNMSEMFHEILLPTSNNMDTVKYNDAVDELGLPYIDEMTLNVQLQDVLDDAKSEVESCTAPYSTTSTQKPQPAASSSGTKGANVENSTPEDLVNRMLSGEGKFFWTNHGQGYIIEIVMDYSAKKLRARTDDGVHGLGWISFPNSLRVDNAVYFAYDAFLGWTGKYYRLSGASGLYRLR